MKNSLLLSIILLVAVACTNRATTTVGTSADVERRIDALLAKMTLQEKIGQMNQISVGGDVANYADAIIGGKVGSILNEVDPAKINAYQHMAVEQSRLGIPLLVSRDVIHGFHTIFPIPLGL